MSTLKITKVCIQRINNRNQVRQIYFVIKGTSNQVFVSSVKKVNNCQNWSQEEKIKIKTKRSQLIYLQIWQYQPNLIVSKEHINIDQFVNNHNVKLLFSDGFLVTVQGYFEDQNLLKYKVNPSKSQQKRAFDIINQLSIFQKVQFYPSINDYCFNLPNNGNQQYIDNKTQKQDRENNNNCIHNQTDCTNFKNLQNQQSKNEGQKYLRRPLNSSQIYLYNTFSQKNLPQNNQKKLSKLIQRSNYKQIVGSIAKSRNDIKIFRSNIIKQMDMKS